MLFTLRELIDLVIMTFAIGYIFSTFIKRRPTRGYDPLTYFKKNKLLIITLEIFDFSYF